MKKSITIFMIINILLLLSYIRNYSQIIWEKNYLTETPNNYLTTGTKIQKNGDRLLLTYEKLNSGVFDYCGLIITDLYGNQLYERQFKEDRSIRISSIIFKDNLYNLFLFYDYRDTIPSLSQAYIPRKIVLDTSLNIISDVFDTANTAFIDHNNNIFPRYTNDSIYVARRLLYWDSLNNYGYTISVLDFETKYIRDIKPKIVEADSINWNRRFVIDFQVSKDNNFIYSINYSNRSTESFYEESRLVKCDYEGKLLWATRIKYENKLTRLWSICENDEGDFICCGETEPDLSDGVLTVWDTNQIQYKSLLLVKVGKNGDIKWMREHPLLNRTSINLRSLSILNNNMYSFVGGYSPYTPGAYHWRKLIILLDSLGEIIYSFDWIMDNYVENKYNIYGLVKNNDTLICYGVGIDTSSIRSLFLVAINPNFNSVTENIKNENSEIIIYPNPASERATLTFSLEPGYENNLKIELFNVLGVKIRVLNEKSNYNSNVSSGNFEFDVGDLHAGVYFIVINNGKTKKVAGFVVER